jgi:aryl-alcohol dehydrogenase-like predicted oxidoreductase
MEHRTLGTSDLQLPVVTFGAWAIGGYFWGGSNDDDAVKAIHAAMDQGIDAIDTAPIYGCGHSETLVGRAIKGRRDKVLILTKCGLRWGTTEGERFFDFELPEGKRLTGYKNVRAASIMKECDDSLRRLGVDVIDLYQVHWPSSSAPAEETMDALSRLHDQGKIRFFGVSNYNAEQLAEAARHAPLVSNQIEYSLLQRGIEGDALPECRKRNIGVLAYSPMCLGILTGKVLMDREFPPSDIRHGHAWYQPQNRKRVLEALAEISPIAEAHGATLGQMAVAWIVAQEGITTALVGARNAQQAVENAAAAHIRLTADEQTHLRQIFEALGEPLKEE